MENFSHFAFVCQIIQSKELLPHDFLHYFLHLLHVYFTSCVILAKVILGPPSLGGSGPMKLLPSEGHRSVNQNVSRLVNSFSKTTRGIFLKFFMLLECLNPLSVNPTKCLNTLKQYLGNLLKNCLSVFDHFVGLALKRLRV